MKKNGEQKEWILPIDSDHYDVGNALRTLNIIDLCQSVQMESANVGDLVYVYCRTTETPGFVAYKGAILAVNKSENIIDDSQFSSDGIIHSGPCFSMAVFRVYELDDELSYAKLNEVGLRPEPHDPVIVDGTLAEYLHSCDDKQRQIDRFTGEIPDECLVNFPISIHEITN